MVQKRSKNDKKKKGGAKSQNSALAAFLLLACVLGAFFYLKHQGEPQTPAQKRAAQARSAQAAEPVDTSLVNLLPRDSVAAVVIDQPRYAQLLLRAGVAEIHADPAWDGYWKSILDETPAEATMLLTLGGALFQDQVALVCTKLDIAGLLEPGYLPPIAVVGELAPRASLLPGYLSGLLEAEQPQGKVSVAPYTWEGKKLTRIALGRNTLYLTEIAVPVQASSDDPEPAPRRLALISWRADTVADLAKAMPARQGLKSNPEFAMITRRLGHDDSHPVLVYLDVDTLKEQVFAHFRRESRRDSLVEWQFLKTQRMLDFLGLQNLKGLGMTVQADEDGVRGKTFVHMDGMEGLMRIYSLPTDPIEGTQFFPPSTVLCNISRMDVANVWRTLRRDLSGIDLDLAQGLDALLNTGQRTLGFDPELLVQTLGDEFGYAVVPGAQIDDAYQTLMVVRTKDNVLVRAAVQLSMTHGVRHETIERGGEIIHVFSGLAPEHNLTGLVSVNPSMAFVHGYTLFGSTPQVVAEAIEARGTGNDITSAPDWNNYLAQLPQERDGIGYISSTYRECLLRFMPFEPRMFDLTRHADLFTSAVSVTKYGTSGIESVSYSPTGSDMLLSGMSAIAALPDLFQIKEALLDMQTSRVLAQVAQAKETMAEAFNLEEGTLITADGSGRNTYDLVLAGYLSSTPKDPRSDLPILLGAIGEQPRIPTEDDLESELLQPGLPFMVDIISQG